MEKCILKKTIEKYCFFILKIKMKILRNKLFKNNFIV